MKNYEIRYSDRLDSSAGNVLEDFGFPWGKRRKAPKTTFRATWNEQALVFGFEVEDADVVLAEADTPGEAVLGSDRVEIFFATDPELKGPYFGAEMDAKGRLYDYRARYHRQFEDGWSFSNLKFRGKVTKTGYAVKGRFSMEELTQLGCLKGKEIFAGVYRAEFSHGKEEGDPVIEDWISWVRPKSKTVDFHVPESFGRFELVR